MKFNRNQKRIARIAAGGAMYIAALVIKAEYAAAKLILFSAAFVIIGGTVIYRALLNIMRGEVFDENFLMSAASAGAFVIGEYSEGVAVMLLYQIGELLQSWAVGKSRRSIAELMDIRPDFANVVRNGQISRVDPGDVKVGEIIVIKPGERIPLDAVITEGSSALDTSALTGESLPRDAVPGDMILSGSINSGGLLSARAAKPFGESTASRILDLVENASAKKSNSEMFITKFARFYTPAVVGLAALLAVVPPLLINGASFYEWLHRALVFLVISCPCALVISIPLSFFAGIGGASRNGILVKGGNYLEALSRAKTVVFDKTGTLTKGVFKVQKIVPVGISESELLETAAYAEYFSNHPIALSLRNEYGREIDSSRLKNAEEIPGFGVKAEVKSRSVAAGSARLMEALGISGFDALPEPGTAVYVASEGKYIGHILIADEVKDDAELAISSLRGAGIRNIAMLTGDAKDIAEQVAKRLGIDRTAAELLPEGKVKAVEEMMGELSSAGSLVFAGDGINDAPVLARADIGVAMGALGSDAAIEAADVVIMNDEPSRLSSAVRISKRTVNIAKQNIALALGIKGIVLLLGALGLASMRSAVFADVGVTLLAILNSMRAMKKI